MGNIRIRVSVILRRDDEVLLVQHHKNNEFYWLLPGGGVEYNESLTDCAIRELKEETNLDIEVGKLAMVSETIAPDGKRHVLHVVFYAREIGGTLKVGEEERLAQAKFVPLKELPSLRLHPPIAERIIDCCRGQVEAAYLGKLWCD